MSVRSEGLIYDAIEFTLIFDAMDFNELLSWDEISELYGNGVPTSDVIKRDLLQYLVIMIYKNMVLKKGKDYKLTYSNNMMIPPARPYSSRRKLYI